MCWGQDFLLYGSFVWVGLGEASGRCRGQPIGDTCDLPWHPGCVWPHEELQDGIPALCRPPFPCLGQPTTPDTDSHQMQRIYDMSPRGFSVGGNLCRFLFAPWDARAPCLPVPGMHGAPHAGAAGPSRPRPAPGITHVVRS